MATCLVFIPPLEDKNTAPFQAVEIAKVCACYVPPLVSDAWAEQINK